MIKSAGIIAEYNPFHLGHKHQVDILRKQGVSTIVAAQSGSCVQRGEISIFSKFERAKMAFSCGVNLLCEIPMPYSCLSAEGFAAAGISILKNLNVDCISFGSESDSLTLLFDIAAYTLCDEFSLALQGYLKKKLPYAVARQKAIIDKFDINPKILSASNDILAIEYIKQTILQNWQVKIIPVKRKGAIYNALTPKDGLASASFVRKAIEEFKLDSACEFIPNENKKHFNELIYSSNYFIPDIAFEKAVLYNLRQKNANDFLNLPYVNKELSHAFENAVLKSYSLESLFNELPTKQYTRARLHRIILFSLLGVTENFQELPPFIRILAMDKQGEQIVKAAKATSKVPISHSYKILKDFSKACEIVVNYESLAGDIQGCFFKNPSEPAKDYTTKLFKGYTE